MICLIVLTFLCIPPLHFFDRINFYWETKIGGMKNLVIYATIPLLLIPLPRTYAAWYAAPLHYILIVTLKAHFSRCFPNHNLMPNHLDWQFKVHEWEAKSETKVATKLGHQVERGMGKNLSWHRHCFANHDGQSRFWDLGFWNNARFLCPCHCMDCRRYHRMEGSGTSCTLQQHLYWHFVYRSVCASAWRKKRTYYCLQHYVSLVHLTSDLIPSKISSYLLLAYSISQGVVQLNFETNFWCKFASLSEQMTWVGFSLPRLSFLKANFWFANFNSICNISSIGRLDKRMLSKTCIHPLCQWLKVSMERRVATAW